MAGTPSQQVPNVILIPKAALAGLERVYREGVAYSKAEALLLGLCEHNECTGDLFTRVQPTEAGQGLRWELMSQSYRTRLDQLWRVK